MSKSIRTEKQFGLCLNDSCEKCLQKTKQCIPLRNDFVCEECGKTLSSCPAPTESHMLKNVITVIAIITFVGGSISAYFMMSDSSNELTYTESVDSSLSADTSIDTTSTIESLNTVSQLTQEMGNISIESEVIKSSEYKKSNGKELGFATFKGQLKNGLPNDANGTMIYKEKHLIDRRDRSEERRGGKECVSTCRYQRATSHYKK